MVRPMRLSIERCRRALKRQRARWASRWRAFYSITLPLAMPGIAAVGVLLAFARSLGEFGATITFVSRISPGETQTLPLAIYGLYTKPRRRCCDPAALRDFGCRYRLRPSPGLED